MPSISSGFSAMGIGTGGVDTGAMLTQLQAAEQLRLKPYTSLQTSYKNKISSWGQISSTMTKLQETVKKLQKEAFNTLTISKNTAFSATATSSATADVHSITVDELATAHKIQTKDPVASADTQLGTSTGGKTRTLTISQKDGSKVSIDLKDDETSLNQVAKEINKQDSNVTATVRRNGDGQYQLMLSSKKTGEDGAMTVTVTGDDALAKHLNSANMSEVTAAKNAEVTVDGNKYTRSSNNISDIISGVTLNLHSVSKDKQPEQLTMTVDTSAIKKTLKEFVDEYNTMLKQTSAASKYVPTNSSQSTSDDAGGSGALMGDATLRGMVTEMRSAANSWYGGSSAKYGSLSSLGITIDSKSGQMSLNEKKLDAAIADNPDEIGKMFKGDNSSGTEGMAFRMASIITKYAGDSESKTDGIIKTTTDNLNTQLRVAGKQIDRTQALIDAQVNRYRVQFQNLDSVMSKLNSISSSVTALMNMR